MKFRTTILLIIFSFTLLLLWDEWVNYNSNVSLTTTTTRVTELAPSVTDDEVESTDLPTFNKLESKEVAPRDEIMEGKNNNEIVNKLSQLT